jgi:glutamate dehydrogenase
MARLSAAKPQAKSQPGEAAAEAGHEAQEAAEHLAASARIIGTDDPDLAGFFTGFTRYASPEDLIRYTGPELASLVMLVFKRAETRAPGTSLITTFTPGDEDPAFGRVETVLLAINDNIPFLYDSCTAAVRAAGAHIRAAFHPVIATSRDAKGKRAKNGKALNESVIVLALDPLSEEEAARLGTGLAETFEQVHAAVRDWKPMLGRLEDAIEELKRNPPAIAKDELAETTAFLSWLGDRHFTFLGSRDYAYHPAGDGRLEPVAGSGLGLLADPNMHVLRHGQDRTILTPDVRAFLNEPSPLIITKSNLRSQVHRRVHMDYIGVKRFDAKGNLTGERRFVGLFTSTAFSTLPADIPLLRHKVEHVIAGSGLPRDGHDGKALAHILDTFPRDELFQIGEDELLATALGILNLGERPKVRVFLRFDRFDRFVSALVYVPRERYNTTVRQRIHGILARAFNGRETAAHPMLDEEALARVHFIIGRAEGPRPDADVRELESDIRNAIRTWEDQFCDALAIENGEARASILSRRYLTAFSTGYREEFGPAEAVDDIMHIESVLLGHAAGGHIAAHVFGRPGDPPSTVRLKIFVKGGFIPLSECLPVFENLGLKVIAEDAFHLNPQTRDGKTEFVALHSLNMQLADGAHADLERLKPLFEEVFHAVGAARADSDGFNRLVSAARMPWRDVSILRALAKYLRQTGFALSQTYVENALAKNPDIARYLVQLFFTLFDPDAFSDIAAREEAAKHLRERIDAALNDVPSADDDRVIRALLAIIGAILRTNFFQRDDAGAPKAYVAFKLASRKLDLLPPPKPAFEIFVYSPEVEGVHLRFGKVARGGLRWSDRAEDFRTEVLGLVKAQNVKNAVIVPVGAKGGFYPKRLPVNASREAFMAAGISAYKTFIGALLDVTDNIGPDGGIVPPPCVVRYDGDDPYLVVAADKGTATFSDIANGIAVERGFWLGDAFASGGSAGYDHKKMGITARGTWEAVKRHFREMGRDCQTDEFTAVGVGDMSGDVFGNGMLMSKKTRLLSAFDHRHIFIDPDPDPEASWNERKRMFDLPRSSWADYDAKLISKGGGVFSRSAKTIRLSEEMKSLTGLKRDQATPLEVIKALLQAEVDLLYFGGIGTFVKSSAQSHAEAGDRANDAVRVNGKDLRAKVVGEGANLGLTQPGRIEYAMKGGRINTDAIDNSAGVDTSDHEVNIKILMSGPSRRGELSNDERDKILEAMTDDVAALVLEDNYDQTEALSVGESRHFWDVDAAGRFMRALEATGRLDRAVEQLPDDEGLRVRERDKRGLTRPENAVLLAYAKLELFEAVIESGLPDEPYLRRLLVSYFPRLAAERFKSELDSHRLKREITGTQLVNHMVNLAGPLFVHRMRELTNAPSAAVIRAYVLAEGAFGLEALKSRIDALDLKVPAAVQISMQTDIAELLRRLGVWFITHVPLTADIAETVKLYGEGATMMRGRFHLLVSPYEKQTTEARITELQAAGVPMDVAEDVAVLPLLGGMPEIVLLAQQQNVSVEAAAGAYFAAGGQMGLDTLRGNASRAAGSDHWDRLALTRIRHDLFTAQRHLAAEALASAKDMITDEAGFGRGAAAVRLWAKNRATDVERTKAFLAELERSGPPSVSKLALANSQIQKMAAGS